MFPTSKPGQRRSQISVENAPCCQSAIVHTTTKTVETIHLSNYPKGYRPRFAFKKRSDRPRRHSQMFEAQVRTFPRFAALVLLALAWTSVSRVCDAQFVRNGAVGGVKVDV